ncbi:MAG: hypothetical protein AAGA93_00355 [Actinomycetota bacterium]
MDWTLDGGWLAVGLGVACAALLVLWWLDRRRLSTVARQTRLRGEAESERLRLRISALKPMEGQAADLRAEVARLQPEADRAIDLDAEIGDLRQQVSEADGVQRELEREMAALRVRAGDVDELELASAKTASRTADLERELAAREARLRELERVDAELEARSDEVERLAATVAAGAERERDLSRQVGVLTEAADRDRAAVSVAEARVEAVEALIAKRDDIILVLEDRLARRGGASGPTTNGHAADGESAGEDRERERRKRIKAERKEAKKEAKRRARKMAKAAADAAAAETADTAADVAGTGRADVAAEPGPSAAVGDGPSPPDDLQAINGIGPVMEQTLNELGIWRFDQLAGLDDTAADELSSQLPGVPGRVEREGWVAQARALTGDGRPSEPSLDAEQPAG